jgi:hypothetical protein
MIGFLDGKEDYFMASQIGVANELAQTLTARPVKDCEDDELAQARL